MSLVSNTGETDEEFARRLQAREMGINLNISLTGPSRRDERADSNTPLIESIGPNIILSRIQGSPNNPTVINARLNELATSRATVLALLIINTPQIISAIIILFYHWNDTAVCNQENRNKWNWWALVSAFRMFLYTSVVVFMHIMRLWIESNGYLIKITQFRNALDASGLIW